MWQTWRVYDDWRLEYPLKRIVSICLLFAATAIILPAQIFTTLSSFDGTDGEFPSAALIQATDGNLYGTTFSGGSGGFGTIVKVTPTGAMATLYSFAGTDGSNPSAALVQAPSGEFYGTTQSGGDF